MASTLKGTAMEGLKYSKPIKKRNFYFDGKP
jgi:hypothetical protein